MDNEGHLNDEEIRLECIRLAVEFAPEIARITDPLNKAQLYYDWVIKNSKRQPEKTASKKDKVKS
jgi:hypothetical protein|tara:strand:+ start:128 stop:322 length:195 start_codon:yes stop_codon:yes gene_type:complete